MKIAFVVGILWMLYPVVSTVVLLKDTDENDTIDKPCSMYRVLWIHIWCYLSPNDTSNKDNYLAGVVSFILVGELLYIDDAGKWSGPLLHVLLHVILYLVSFLFTRPTCQQNC